MSLAGMPQQSQIFLSNILHVHVLPMSVFLAVMCGRKVRVPSHIHLQCEERTRSTNSLGILKASICSMLQNEEIICKIYGQNHRLCCSLVWTFFLGLGLRPNGLRCLINIYGELHRTARY